MSRPRLGFAAVLVIVLAAGCAEIPTSGPVVEGEAVPEQLPVSVGFVPNPPVAGASETDIVQGFLEAMASYEAGYQTAKEFLTPDARVGLGAVRGHDDLLGHAYGYPDSPRSGPSRHDGGGGDLSARRAMNAGHRRWLWTSI